MRKKKNHQEAWKTLQKKGKREKKQRGKGKKPATRAGEKRLGRRGS